MDDVKKDKEKTNSELLEEVKKLREETEKQNIAEIRIAKHRNGPLGVVNLFFNERLASFRNLEKEENIYEPEE